MEHFGGHSLHSVAVECINILYMNNIIKANKESLLLYHFVSTEKNKTNTVNMRHHHYRYSHDDKMINKKNPMLSHEA